MITVMDLQLILFLLSFLHGIYGQVTVPPSTTAALGEDVSLECTTTETDPTFTWTYATESQLLYYGDDKSTNVPRYANIVLQGGTNARTSILNISAIQLEEEGEYLCTTTTATTTPPTTTVTVEVASASKEIDLISVDDFANYQATCDAIGSKPEETITWVLNGDTQPDGSESDPGTSADPLFDKRSVFKFPASLDNYNVTLVCEIGGHQDPVSSLNRQESRRVDIHKRPQSGDIVIKFTSDGTDLTVLCDTEGAAAIPPMDSFFIYSALIDNPESGNTVTVTLPQNDTEFTCVGGNYLDNTTTTTTFEPGSTTTPPPVTALETTTSNGNKTGDGKQTAEPSANVAAIAGGVVAAIVIIVIIVIAVCYCKKQERFCFEAGGFSIQALFSSCKCSLPTPAPSNKPSGRAVGSSNGSGSEKEKLPQAAPRGHGSIQHTNDNPDQAMYAMVDKKPARGGGGAGDAPDRGSAPGQNEPQGMLYADLDLSHKAGHTDKHVPKNENDVVVYSSILV